MFFQGHYFIKTNNNMNSKTNIEDMSYFKHKIAITNSNRNKFIFSNNIGGYGIRLFDFDNKFIATNKIDYCDKKLSYYISFVNANSYDDYIGFMVVVDGQVQPFSLDGNTTEQIIHNEHLKSHSLINIPITFNPKINDNLYKHTIYFLAIYKQHTLPSKGEPYVDTYTAPYMCELDISKSSHNNLSKTINSNNFKINSVDINKGLTSNNWTSISNGLSIEPLKSNNELSIVSNKNDNFYTFGSILPNNIYSTIVFLDNKPVTLPNGDFSILWSPIEKKMMYYNFNIKGTLSEGTHQIYSVTLPLSNATGQNFFESGKIKLNVKNK